VEDWVREDTAERVRGLYNYRRSRFGGDETGSRNAPSSFQDMRVTASLLYKGPPNIQGANLCYMFCLQISRFSSGAEGIRTPDLRRAKSAR
jgi:hypothetical protein